MGAASHRNPVHSTRVQWMRLRLTSWKPCSQCLQSRQALPEMMKVEVLTAQL
nr:MAG TPA: hypothetical protein [Caudoviricetes sp.]